MNRYPTLNHADIPLTTLDDISSYFNNNPDKQRDNQTFDHWVEETENPKITVDHIGKIIAVNFHANNNHHSIPLPKNVIQGYAEKLSAQK